MSAILGSCAYGGSLVYIPLFILIAKLAGIPTIMGTTIIITADLFMIWITILVTLFSNYAVTSILAQKQKHTAIQLNAQH